MEVNREQELLMTLITEVNVLKAKVDEIIKSKAIFNQGCFTADEVAMLAGCSVSTIQKKEAQGKIKAQYPAAKRRYSRTAVEKFLRGV